MDDLGMLYTDSTIVRRIGDETLVLDARSDRIHHLNATASLVWRLVHDGTPPEAIVSAVISEFDVESSTAARDIDDILRTLRDLHLLASG